MEQPALLVPLLALVLTLAWQVQRLSRGANARNASRASFLERCNPLFSDVRLQLEPHGFPRMAGVHGGACFDLQVVPDTLTTRKLPALWLLATLTEPQPLGATWHLMLRPRGSEIFSGFWRLPRQLAPQPDLPTDSAVRTDSANGSPPPELARLVERLGEGRLKEIVLSPKGLRITWLLEEAHRTRYLAFRDAEMGLSQLSLETLAPLLKALLDLRGQLKPERLRA